MFVMVLEQSQGQVQEGVQKQCDNGRGVRRRGSFIKLFRVVQRKLIPLNKEAHHFAHHLQSS